MSARRNRPARGVWGLVLACLAWSVAPAAEHPAPAAEGRSWLGLSATSEGVVAAPLAFEGKPWSLDLRISSVTVQGHTTTLGAAQPSASDNEISYDFGAATVRYLNERDGLKQIIRLPLPGQLEPLPGTTKIAIDVTIGSDLSPRADGYFVDLLASDGRQALRYGGIRATDATGAVFPGTIEPVPATETAPAGARILLELTDAVFPIEVEATLTHPARLEVAQPPDGSKEIVGKPVTLGAGITRTVAEIMELERATPALQLTAPRETHHEYELEEERDEDEEAPPASESFAPPDPWTPAERAALLGPPALPQAVGTSFTGVSISEAPYIPPDSMGAVGPTQIVVHTNGRIKTFTKAGIADGALNAADTAFWGSVAAGISDPQVRYDRLSGRWIFLAITVAESVNNKIVLAVSSGPTISSQASFTFYSFSVGSAAAADATNFCDYPGFGIDANAIYTGCNMFNPSFRWTSAYVIRKSSVLSGGPIVVTGFANIATTSVAGPYSPRGVDNDDPTWTEGYIIGSDPSGASRLNIRRVSNPGGTPTLGANVQLAVTNTNLSPQRASGSTTQINVSDPRLFAASIRKNKLTGATTLWTANSVETTAACAPSTTGNTRRLGARWFEIGTLTTTPTILQQGILCTTGPGGAAINSERGFMYPTAIATGQGHLALAASYASNTEFAGIASAGRLRTDPSGGTRAPETIVQAGLAAYTLLDNSNRNRWGDYSSTQVDPNDDQTVWTFQEYADTTACGFGSCWAVRAVQLKAPPPPAIASATAVCAGLASATSTVTGSDACANPTCTNGLCTGGGACPEFFDPGPDTGGPGYASHIAATVAGGVTVNPFPATGIVIPGSPSTTRVLQSTLSLNTTAAAGGTQSLTIVNPDGQTSAGSILVVGATPTNGGPICAGQTLQLNAATVPGATYAWTGPDGFASALQNPFIPNATTAASGTYSLSVTVAGVCTSPLATTMATVSAGPAAPATSNNGPICNGATLQLNASTVPGATYSWTGPNGFVSSLQNPTIPSATAAATGTYNVTVTSGGCTSSAGTTSATVIATNGACGSSSSSACDNPDTCNGAGVCQSNHVGDGSICGDLGTACVNQDLCVAGVCQDNGFKASGTACGSSSSGPCDNADTCNGAGVCQTNNVGDGTLCGDAGSACVNQDLCVAGVCQDNGFAGVGTACGSSSTGPCDGADTCNGAGVCQTNNASDGTLCGDAGSACVNQDLCIAGVCQDNGFAGAGTACGSSSTGPCDNPDTCDGSGGCQTNNVADGTNCGDAGTACVNQDTCLAGACQDNGFAGAGTACGSSSTGSCDNPDTCDGSGGCQTNNVADGTNCGDAGTACVNQDTCLAGACQDNGFAGAGTACGSSSTGPCDNADTCDGSGACQTNNVGDGTLCGDAASACVNQDLCIAGTCQDNGFKDAGAACGSASSNACDAADTCDGAGLCQPNNVANGTNCGDAGTACVHQDTCLDGACHDNGFAGAGTACGSSSTGPCDNADTCNGAGVCQTNNVGDGTLCGDAGSACVHQDFCVAGACQDNGFASAGTACGSSSTGPCDNADACNGAGACLANHVTDGTTCSDADPTTCNDACAGGICAGTPTAEPSEINASVRIGGDKATISWTDPGGPYNVYRGSNGAGAWSYNQTCFSPNQAGSTASDPSTPASGTFIYYLISRRDSCRESVLGTDSSNTPDPNTSPCP